MHLGGMGGEGGDVVAGEAELELGEGCRRDGEGDRLGEGEGCRGEGEGDRSGGVEDELCSVEDEVEGRGGEGGSVLRLEYMVIVRMMTKIATPTRKRAIIPQATNTRTKRPK